MITNKKHITKLASLLAVLTCAGVVLTPAYKVGYASANDVVTLWAETSTEKILQDENYGKEGGTISIAMAKNEYEGAQMQAYAKVDVSSYDVDVNLSIPYAEVNIYVEKYQMLTVNTSGVDAFPAGANVPDALVPIANIQAYGEDTIEKGKNQGYYIEVETTKDTPAGTYTGEVTLEFNGAAASMPIQVTVWDIKIPENSSLKNYWNIANRTEQMMPVGYNSSEEMQVTYFEKMLEYRISSELPFTGIGGTQKYVELLRKYYDYEGFSAYRFYYEYKNCVYDNQECYFDYQVMKEYLKEVAKASVEDKKNYLDKAFMYFLSIDGMDEPSTEAQFERMQNVSNLFGQIVAETAEELKSDLIDSENYGYYRHVVYNTLKAMPCLVTLHEDRQDLIPSWNDEYVTYCVQAQHLDTANNRAFYANTNDTYWTYTCNTPVNPYISTHIDNYSATTRLIGWMQKDYGIDGYLNWAVSMHPVTEGEAYNTPQINEYANGDGFILYPGSDYGVEGPVGSLRAVAFRDGMEDAELLELFKEKYGDTELQKYYDMLYSGTQVGCTEAEILNARNYIAAGIMDENAATAVTGESVTISDSTVKSNISFVSSLTSSAAINSDATYAKSNESVKISLKGKLLSEAVIYFGLPSSLFNNANFSEIEYIKLWIYAPENIDFWMVGLDGSTEYEFQKVKLQAGWNEVLFTDFRMLEDVSVDEILFKTQYYEDSKTFYLDELHYVKKA